MLSMRKKTSLLNIVGLLLIFTVSFFTGKALANWGTSETPKKGKGVTAAQNSEVSKDKLNILLLGIDARPGEKDARTDSMILVSIDRDTKKIAMLSIPRDTLVDIEGHGQDKINSANFYGGVDLARKSVENLLGLNIPYYVKTNFNGFKDIVDTLGGVTLDVEKRMYYPSEQINLRPGTQKLSGANALAYVRFRHDALGDIARTERQQKFLTALAKEILQPSTIVKLPKLVPELMSAVDTNLGVSDVFLLSRAASSVDSNNIVSATLPGVFYNYKGVSYWKVDYDKAKAVLSDLMDGVKIATVSGPDVDVPADKPVYKAKKDQNNSKWQNTKNNNIDNKQNDTQKDANQTDTNDGQINVDQTNQEPGTSNGTSGTNQGQIPESPNSSENVNGGGGTQVQTPQIPNSGGDGGASPQEPVDQKQGDNQQSSTTQPGAKSVINSNLAPRVNIITRG